MPHKFYESLLPFSKNVYVLLCLYVFLYCIFSFMFIHHLLSAITPLNFMDIS